MQSACPSGSDEVGDPTRQILPGAKGGRLQTLAEQRDAPRPDFEIDRVGDGAVASSRRILWRELRSGRIKVGSTNRTHGVFEIGAVRIAALERALASLIDAYPVIGGRIEARGGLPWIVPDRRAPPRIEVLNVDGLDEAEVLVSARIWCPFDVGEGPLYRLIIATLPTGKVYVAMVLHHFVADGMAITLLVNQLLWRYRAFERDGVLPESERTLGYGDYLAALDDWNRTATALRHRRDIIDRYATLGALDLSGLVIHSTAAEERFEVDTGLAEGVRALAKSLRTTVFTVLLAAQYAMLAPFCSGKTLGIKIVTTGREAPILLPVIGNLTDRSLISVELNPMEGFDQLVAATARAIQIGRKAPFVRDDFVQEELSSQGLSGATPIFNFQTLGRTPARPVGPVRRFTVREAEGVAITRPADHYFLFMHDDGERFMAKVQYARGRMAGLTRAFMTTLAEIVENPDARIETIAGRAWGGSDHD